MSAEKQNDLFNIQSYKEQDYNSDDYEKNQSTFFKKIQRKSQNDLLQACVNQDSQNIEKTQLTKKRRNSQDRIVKNSQTLQSRKKEIKTDLEINQKSKNSDLEKTGGQDSSQLNFDCQELEQDYQEFKGNEMNQKSEVKNFRQLLFDIQITNIHQNPEVEEMKKLAADVLKLMWDFCQEDMLIPSTRGLQPQFEADQQLQNQQNNFVQMDVSTFQQNNAELTDYVQGNINVRSQQFFNRRNQIDQNQQNNQLTGIETQQWQFIGRQSRLVQSQTTHFNGNLSLQLHSLAVDNLCLVLSQQYRLSSFFFMNLCVQNLKRDFSIPTTQKILRRIIQNTSYPIIKRQRTNQSQQNQINSFIRKSETKESKDNFPKNQSELIQALDKELKISDECLSSYVEFKRNAVQAIFEQFGNLQNEALGILDGDHYENLETQSSLYNNSTVQTAEERSRFSQSIISSTQKSDTVDYMTNVTRSQQKSQKTRASKNKNTYNLSINQTGAKRSTKGEAISQFNNNIIENRKNKKHLERASARKGKRGTIQTNVGQQNLQEGLRHVLDLEPNSSTVKTKQSLDFTPITLVKGISLAQDQSDSAEQLKTQQIDQSKVTFDSIITDSSNLQKEDTTDMDNKAQNHKKQKPKNENDKQIKDKKRISQEEEEIEPSTGSVDQNATSFQSETITNGSRTANNRNFLKFLVTNKPLQLNFQQEMIERLSFFTFITTKADCKTLKNWQINILWNCLVVNAFNELERDQFFLFCTHALSALQSYTHAAKFYVVDNQAGGLLFEEDTFEMIFFEILLRLDFKGTNEGQCSFTPAMYQCFERYFLHVNEQYGQVVTHFTLSKSDLNQIGKNNVNSNFSAQFDQSPQQFDVFDSQLIGIEAVWEIILGVQDDQIYKRASEFLMLLYKRMELTKLKNENEEDKSDNIFELNQKNDSQPNLKEQFLQNCLKQIKAGLKVIETLKKQILVDNFQERGHRQSELLIQNLRSRQIESVDILNNNFEENFLKDLEAPFINHSDLLNNLQVSEAISRITRSLKLLNQFVLEFEGKVKQVTKEKKEKVYEVLISVGNNISNNSLPRKLELKLPSNTKIGDLKDKIGQQLIPKKLGNELEILYRGKDLSDDHNTLKDEGMKNTQDFDGSLQSIKIILWQKSHSDFKSENIQNTTNDFSQEDLNEALENMRSFLGELTASEKVTIRALKKCKLNLGDALILLTDPDKLIELDEEIQAEEAANEEQQLAEARLKQQKKQEGKNYEYGLKEMISNRTECFDLLFGLLNLGLPDITEAAWTLLTQVPVNQILLNKIRNLTPEVNWESIVDASSLHKMLYSLQLVSQLISISTDKQLSEADSQQWLEWRQNFLELGGFEHLYKILINYNFEQVSHFSQNSFNINQKQKNRQNSNENTDQQIQTQRQLNKKSSKTVANIQILEGQRDLMIKTQVQCLGHLVSIIKIFMQAAFLSDDRKKLLTLIASQSTSPFKKQAITLQIPNMNQENISSKQSNETLSEDKSNSSANTPKFGNNSFSSASVIKVFDESLTDIDQQQHSKANKNIETKSPTSVHEKVSGNQMTMLNTQVDDFPRLIQTMNQKTIGKKLLSQIDFGGMVQLLLKIIKLSTCIFNQMDSSNFDQKQIKQNETRETFNQDSLSLLVQNSMDLLMPCILWEPENYLNTLIKFHGFEELLVNGLLENKSEKVRKCIESNLRSLFQFLEDQQLTYQINSGRSQAEEQLGNLLSQTKIFVLQILLKNLPTPINGIKDKKELRNFENEYYEEYFSLLSVLIKSCSKFLQGKPILEDKKDSISEESILINCIQIIKETYQMISQGIIPADQKIKGRRKKKLLESELSGAERLLCGYLQLSQSLLEVLPSLKEIAGQRYQLIQIIAEFIFNQANLTDENKQSAQIFKLNKTKKRAFSLLLTLCGHCEKNFASTLDLIFKFHKKINHSWQFTDYQEFLENDCIIKQTSGYVGLKNFSSTCYMNSLLQQLYMVPALRKQVLNLNFSDIKEQNEQNILYQIQKIFTNLQESEKSYFIPSGFVQTFKFYGEPVNVRVQQDTHEFFHVLCDQIEQILPKSNKNNFLKNLIGGTLCYETRSLESQYPYIGEREEDFYAIQLDIKNRQSLAEALDFFVKPDVLDGDNKYFSDQYDKKISVQRRTYLKDLAPTVVINLKRFEYDYNTQQRIKLNDYCQFPFQINFKKWTFEGIKDSENLPYQQNKQKNADVSPKVDNVVQENILLEKQTSSENQKQKVEITVQEEDGIEADILKQQKSIQLRKKDAVGGVQMDEGIIDEDLPSDDQLFQKKGSGINKRAASISGGSRKSAKAKRRVRSNTKTFEIIEQNQNQNAYLPGQSELRNLGVNLDLAETVTKKKQQKLPDDGNDSEKQEILMKTISSDDTIDKYNYELVGVLIHSGSANSGHYFSYIKERNRKSVNFGKWFEFNDKTVKRFDIGNLGKESFGGQTNQDKAAQSFYQNQKSSYDQQSIINSSLNGGTIVPASTVYQRSCNAYLLFYEQVQKDEDEFCYKEETNDESGLVKRIREENQAFKNLKIFTDADYIKFALEFLNLITYQDVLYFGPQFSQSNKIINQKKLTQDYFEDWDGQVRKGKRQAATQQLKGAEVTPFTIELAQNYRQEQIQIRTSSQEIDIFNDSNIEETTVGFRAIQLGTMLAFDILLKLKDSSIFIQLIQRLTKVYESHALVCVWFLKWNTEQINIIEEVLLIYNQPEVREVYQNLLATSFSVTVKNEESYLNEVEEMADFEQTEQNNIELGKVQKMVVYKSSALRFLILFVGNQNYLMNCARINWRNFNEFFMLLIDLAQTNFKVTNFMIKNGMILSLIDFILNGKLNSNSQIQEHTKSGDEQQQQKLFYMGDSLVQPNFQQVITLFSYLIRACLTEGIMNMKHYSPLSIFQSDECHIMLPIEQIAPFLNPQFFQDFLQATYNSNETSKVQLSQVLIHLSWSNSQVSLFFINQIINHIRQKKSNLQVTSILLNLLSEILNINDSTSIKISRFECLLQFTEKQSSMFYLNEIVGVYGDSYQTQEQYGKQQLVAGLFSYMLRQRESYPIHLMKILNFLGKLALIEAKKDAQNEQETEKNENQIFLNYLRTNEIKSIMEPWLGRFIESVASDDVLVSRAQTKFGIRLQIFSEQTWNFWKKILEIKDAVRLMNRQKLHKNEEVNQQWKQKPVLMKVNGAMDLEELAQSPVITQDNEKWKIYDQYLQNDEERYGEEESIFNLIPPQKRDDFESLN